MVIWVVLPAFALTVGLRDAAPLLRYGPSVGVMTRCLDRCVMEGLGEEPATPESKSAGTSNENSEAGMTETKDLSQMDFDQRLKVLSSRVPAASAESATGSGEVDLAKLDFDQRLQVLASRIPDVEPSQPPKAADDDIFPEGSPETNWWSPAFWKLCAQDLQTLEWPSRKQVFQTVFTSQLAFVVIICITLVFDATVESGVRTLLQGEPFTLTVDKILKIRAN